MNNDKSDHSMSRRNILKSSAPLLEDSLMVGEYAEPEIRNLNKNSSPSDLKITNLRVAALVKPGPSPFSAIRVDTNQGVYGLGEVRDWPSPTCALMLKSRILG